MRELIKVFIYHNAAISPALIYLPIAYKTLFSDLPKREKSFRVIRTTILGYLFGLIAFQGFYFIFHADKPLIGWIIVYITFIYNLFNIHSFIYNVKKSFKDLEDLDNPDKKKGNGK